MVLSGMRLVLFPQVLYSSKLFFPAPFRIAFNCTFTMTAPSLRCKLTFFPMYDFALLTLKFSIQSPLLLLVSYFDPTLITNWQRFTFYLDVQFNVFALAMIVPRVLTVLHIISSLHRFWCFLFLSQMPKQHLARGEGWL
jgi:hypothetical protein